MHQVNDEYNGLVLESNFSQNQLFVGKGAGSEPTGSAVVSDISALSYQYRYEYKKIQQANGTMFNNDLIVKVYLRFRPYASINLTRFINISEKFSNAEGSYVIGEINLKDLPYYQKNDPTNTNIIIIE
jgi:homoserine dehydrogenase